MVFPAVLALATDEALLTAARPNEAAGLLCTFRTGTKISRRHQQKNALRLQHECIQREGDESAISAK